MKWYTMVYYVKWEILCFAAKSLYYAFKALSYQLASYGLAKAKYSRTKSWNYMIILSKMNELAC